jgi:hypothetical protein
VLESIRKGDGRWEEDVPVEVAMVIRERGLFGMRKAG